MKEIGGMKMVESITAKELEKIYKDDGVNIIDVREDDEVAVEKIPGSLHLPMSQFPEVMNQLDKDTEYYVICRTNNRSTKAAEQLIEEGYHAKVISDGMQGWEGKTK